MVTRTELLAGLALVVLPLSGCKEKHSAKSHGDDSHGGASSHGEADELVAKDQESLYLAAIAPQSVTPLMPQCVQQRHASSSQLAPSYFEQMQPCNASLPPQLRTDAHEGGHGGKLDEKGDCNLGKVGATEVVCHYHSSFEFTSRDSKPLDPANTVEVHCIAFKLQDGQRQAKPIVFGTQLTCKAGTMPGGHNLAAGGHGDSNQSHDGAGSCGSQIPEIFADVQTCDMRCCRDGTLTKANPGMQIRPSFAICAAPRQEVDCGVVLANMHAHAPHRPHDLVGPDELYRQAKLEAKAGKKAPAASKAQPKIEQVSDMDIEQTEFENLPW